MSKSILITGSSGFVCKHLINRLLKLPELNIIATYREIKGDYKENPRLTFEKADLHNPSSFENIFRKHRPNFVVHLAAMARVRDGENEPAKVLKANYIGTLSLIKMAIKYKVCSVITTSSNLAQDPVSVVGMGKYLIEQDCQNLDTYSTKVINFRMPNVIDSNGAVTLIFKRQIENNQSITITHPDMSRMFITGEKASSWLEYLLYNGEDKGVYVSYDPPTKITDLAKNMIDKSGKKIDIKFIGIKPGEKLVEKCFLENDVKPTEIKGLGKIKNYRYNKTQVVKVIDKLLDIESISNFDDIQSIFADHL